MTNQLTYTDLDPTITVRPPRRATTSTPITPPDRPNSGRRWKLVVGGAVVATAAAVTIATLGCSSADTAPPLVEEQSPAYLIVQGEIDAALAQRQAVPELSVQRPAYLIVQNEIDAALAERNGVDVGQARPTAQIVQDEIDAALAERQAGAAVEEQRPAYLIVQGEIDAALAERNAGVQIHHGRRAYPSIQNELDAEPTDGSSTASTSTDG